GEVADLPEVHSIDVADRGVALEAVRVGAHLFPFARELPLALEAQARAARGADLAGARPRLMIERERLAGRDVLFAIDAEALLLARGRDALRRLGVFGAAVIPIGARR